MLVCPQCQGALDIDPKGAVCRSCGRTYARHGGGFLDLTLDRARYEDWLSASEEASERWLNGPALTEAAGAQHMMRSYLAPLLRRLGLGEGAAALSVGCGGAWDVEALHQEGFLAWGIDNGGRVMVWKDRACAGFLSLADALRQPFPDGAFDFVFSEGVIEHIGSGRDSLHQQPDWQLQRQRFADSLVRVTKPGGYLLVACPNRLFPIDFFHGGKPFRGMRIRFHSPFETFLLSYGDIMRLFGKEADWITPLSLANFFNLGRVASQSRLMALSTALAEHAFKLLPNVFWGTPVSPYLVVLIRKART